MKRYRAVLWDYPEGEPGGGGPDSTLSYEQLPKTEWRRTREAAQEDGEDLNAKCGYDFFVRIEEEVVSEQTTNSHVSKNSPPPKPMPTKSYFLIWEDWQDEQSHGMAIDVPEGEDPEVFAHQFLSNYGELGKFGFLIESVKEIKEGEKVSRF